MPSDKRTTEEQDLPVINQRPYIRDLVIQDLIDKTNAGAAKYGTHLQPFNHRSGLRDLYQELLDAACYTRQLIYEDEGK